jgi:exodeoxyribonuclease-5
MQPFTPTAEQAEALARISDWANDPTATKCFVLAGLAGTGKTSLMRVLRDYVGDQLIIRYLAPTNKASSVLRSKDIPAQTIHSVFYTYVGKGESGQPEFEFTPGQAGPHVLFVIDEASMIDSDTLGQLLSTRARFLFVGDHGQLPPVGNDPGLMRDADVRLETVMRQANGNEILTFAHHIRAGGDPFEFQPTRNDVLIAPPGVPLKRLPSVNVWLCWRNYTRVQLNMLMLKAHTEKGQDFPAVIPVQIRSNYHEQGIFNGEVYDCEVGMWDRQSRHPTWGVLQLPDSLLKVRFHPNNWHKEKRAAFRTKFESEGVLADYGYAITAHSSQGSEWDIVAVVDEAPDTDAARWRYTAATRAAKKLIWMPFNALPVKRTAEVVG